MPNAVLVVDMVRGFLEPWPQPLLRRRRRRIIDPCASCCAGKPPPVPPSCSSPTTTCRRPGVPDVPGALRHRHPRAGGHTRTGRVGRRWQRHPQEPLQRLLQYRPVGTAGRLASRQGHHLRRLHRHLRDAHRLRRPQPRLHRGNPHRLRSLLQPDAHRWALDHISKILGAHVV